ncbi:hypothetical protein E2C01_074728 [Portunus trituberculatus]|uniref:Uncharacterized protein n=1 Tax=Portunus trituberculatus TaxID=210409 RepID=A0A5B7IE94_PORTR|nr:hypothetical protein [Portunus trituberculatus]
METKEKEDEEEYRPLGSQSTHGSTVPRQPSVEIRCGEPLLDTWFEVSVQIFTSNNACRVLVYL